MQLLLTYFIGLQVGLQFLAGYFTFKIARLALSRVMKTRVAWSLVTVGILILTARRIQALLSVKLILDNFNKVLAPISIDTIIVQTIVSVCLVIGFSRIYKYMKTNDIA